MNRNPRRPLGSLLCLPLSPLAAALALSCVGPPEAPPELTGSSDASAAQALVSTDVCLSVRRGGSSGAVHDTQILSSSPDDNYGDLERMVVGTAGGTKSRALLQFDLDAIPPGNGTHITSANLTLFTRGHAFDSGTPRVHRITRAWDEATITWNSFDDAFDSQESATLSASSDRTYLFTSIQPLLRDWVERKYQNHGLILIQPDWTVTVLRTSEDKGEREDEAKYRPILDVCYNTTCQPRFADCNAQGLDGCETNLDTSADHCGACDHACALAHATPACTGGACGVASCDAGFADCNGDAADGCEVDLATSVDHCGACDHACALPHATAACTGGACAVAACDAGRADCNGDAGDGCESGLDTASDCGSCGVPCALPNAAASCATGVCHLTTCVPGFFDCDNDPATGCEPFPCAEGSLCANETWCASGVCDGGVCAAPSCSDAVQNHGEVGVDCGGPCGNYVKKVAAGEGHSLVLEVNGTLWAAGRNDAGQLGDGTNTDRESFVQVLSDVADVAAGAGHTVAVKTDGTVWAAGRNDAGQLGDGTLTNRNGFVQAPSFTGAVEVAAGAYHSLVVREAGGVRSLWAVGLNDASQLGDGTSQNRSTYVEVLGDVQSAAAEQSRSFALKTDGNLWATGSFACYQECHLNCNLLDAYVCYDWCYDTYCCLPQDILCKVSSPPLPPPLGCPATCASICCPQTCSTVCPTFNPVLTGGDVAQVTAGVDHALVVKDDNTLWATGSNDKGQLGDETTTSQSGYVQVLDGVAKVAAGQSHTVAVKTDGTFWVTGDNTYGQLGAGSTHGRTTFAKVPALAGVAGVAAGAFHTLVVTSDGALRSTGYNNEGQLGDGTLLDHDAFTHVEIPSCPEACGSGCVPAN